MKNRLTFPKEAPEMKSSGSLPSLASVSSSSLRTVDAPITRDQFEQHHTNHFKKSQMKGANKRGTRTDPKTPLKKRAPAQKREVGNNAVIASVKKVFQPESVKIGTGS
mmetsp:Transcript_27286/g.40552  ORF Transcript_27286/g.40552 Transcript_27286/m.40552 type:complete len:108 (+) Transcript_27286:88-411(+)